MVDSLRARSPIAAPLLGDPSPVPCLSLLLHDITSALQCCVVLCSAVFYRIKLTFIVLWSSVFTIAEQNRTEEIRIERNRTAE